mgnify:CR=1 FL=1
MSMAFKKTGLGTQIVVLPPTTTDEEKKKAEKAKADNIKRER